MENINLRKIDRIGKEWGGGGDQMKSELRPGFRRKCEWCRKSMSKSILIEQCINFSKYIWESHEKGMFNMLEEAQTLPLLPPPHPFMHHVFIKLALISNYWTEIFPKEY